MANSINLFEYSKANSHHYIAPRMVQSAVNDRKMAGNKSVTNRESDGELSHGLSIAVYLLFASILTGLAYVFFKCLTCNHHRTSSILLVTQRDRQQEKLSLREVPTAKQEDSILKLKQSS